MKKLLLLAALFVAPSAFAQQSAIKTNCTFGLDGGTTTATFTCPQIGLNYSPATFICEVATAGSHLVGTTTVLVSNDGVNFATVADAGLNIAYNQDVNATTSFALSISPTDPYLFAEVQTAITINDGGTAALSTLNCQQAVIQTQTLHAVRPKK